MNEAVSLAQMRQLYQRWIDNDFFAFARPMQQTRPTSLRDFIHGMAVANTLLKEKVQADIRPFPDLTDLNRTMGELLAMSVKQPGGDLTSVRSMVFQEFCVSVVTDLALAISHDHAETSPAAEMFEECRVTDWQGWRDYVRQEETAQQIALVLFDDLVAKVQGRTLYSFFVREHNQHGFLSWGPYADSGFGIPLSTHTIETSGRTVEVTVRRYDEHPDLPVTAYEWNAKLSGAAPERPDAVACGMVYVMEREDGEPVGDDSDLLQAADSIADTDVLQVNSFLRQHPDATQIIAKSDLCFVWLWERRADAEHGTGALCLQAAVQNLQKRFKRIKTVIVDTKPSQFVAWDMPKDPPMIEVAKQTAIERLVSYMQTLSLPKAEIRHIFNHHEGDPIEAMRALGEEGLVRRVGALMDQHTRGGLVPDWQDHADDLAELFHQAGLPDLCDRVCAGTADYYEIERVLVHLLLHRRIPYLPLTMTPDVDLDELYGGEEPEDDVDPNLLEEFIDSLPDDVEVHRVRYCSGPLDGPGWVVCVVMDIGFAELEEFFTFTPVPRPIDASKFLG